MDMVFDSGSGHTTLDEAVAARLGLDLSMKALSSGAKGKQEISVIKGLTLHFSGQEIVEPLTVAYPLDFLTERVGRKVDGIIGIEFLHRHVVELNYADLQVRIHEPATYEYKGSGEVLPLTFSKRMPIVIASLTTYGGGPVAARLMVDCGGARASAMLWKAFDDRHGLLAGAREVKQVSITGFGGTTRQMLGRIQQLRVGGITIENPEVGLIDYVLGDPNTYDGTIGSGVLKQFKVIFDLPHSRLILERPASR
ncbi:MAG: aspartyl protease family protein [Bryobacteraceae bacterium]|nr:aspartyl protease family protein [Bryobacteraceae bacterium]